MDVSIANNDSTKAALKFLGLWRRSFSDGGFDRAIEPLAGLVSPETPAVTSVAPVTSAVGPRDPRFSAPTPYSTPNHGMDSPYWRFPPHR